ncbi:hypothetical protein So717_38520 [Roseobacter cerasinus]|uniref:Uncharacterized protein n=1 Tax=Roseobacter cerasinus TaxID=2602289 RepID=A0A640VVP7_9RHOB|nr:hypothetical protein So717_38520 [Roseobacter cerasinus]
MVFKRKEAPYLPGLEGEPACQNCRFGVVNGDIWQCRRYPPTAVRRGSLNAIITVEFEVPTVSPGYWCGEFIEVEK